MLSLSISRKRWSLLFLLLCSGIFFLSPQLHAQASECDQGGGGSDSQELKACKKFSCQARKACESAKNSASKNNNSEANQLAGKYAGNDQVANPAFDMSDLGKRSADSLGKASAYCRGLSGGPGGAAQSSKQASKTCRTECDPKKIKAGTPNADEQKQEMQKERDACLSQIEQTAQGLDKAQTDNKAAEEGGKKTGEAAQKGQGDQDKGKKDDQPQDKSGQPQPKPEEKNANTDPTGCQGAQAADDPKCATVLQNTCRGDKLKTDPNCQQFAANFCGPGQSAAKGSGAGAELCQENLQNKMVTEFCATPGRSHCPSCGGKSAHSIASASAQELAKICGTCAGSGTVDPIFSNPAVAKACSGAMSPSSSQFGSASVNGGGSSHTSGSGGGGGSGGVSGGSTGEATLGEGKGLREESAYGQLNKQMTGASDGGGGGGASYGGGDHSAQFGDSSAGDEGFGRSVAGANFDGDNFSPASDVVPKVGPSVFLIQSTVIRNRCDKGQFMHCDKSK